MNQFTKERPGMRGVEDTDAEVIVFRSRFGDQTPLDELVRLGAQEMLTAALEHEVQSFLEKVVRIAGMRRAIAWWSAMATCRRGRL